MDLEKKHEKDEIFFVSHRWYSITICPNDKYQYFGHNNRLDKFINLLNEITLTFKSFGIVYIFWIELSEPRSKSINGPRLHTHGIIKFCSNKSVRKFLLDFYYLLSRIGILDFDTINNLDKWIKYCTKQQKIIKTEPITNFQNYKDQLEIELKKEKDKEFLEQEPILFSEYQ